MTSTRSRAATRRALSRRPGARSRDRSRTGGGPPATRLLLAGLAAAVLLALVLAVVIGGSGDDGDAAPTGEPVTVDGAALPELPAEGDDPAVGSPMPTLRGTDLAGRPVTVGPDGRPQIVMVLAHWCPHCRAEVPVVQDWVDRGGLPEGVELVSVATANDDRRPNFPAADWLEGEGWTAPVLLDDERGTAGTALGVSAFPYWLFVDADGTVVARATGELTPDQLDALAADLADRGS